MAHTTASFPPLLSRAFKGFLSGGAGSIVMGIVLLLGWGVLSDALTAPDVVVNEFGVATSNATIHPLFGVVVIVGIFFSTLAAHLLHMTLSTLSGEKLHTPRQVLFTQTFFVHLVLLVASIPLYVLANVAQGPIGTAMVAIAHAMSGALLGHGILHFVNRPRREKDRTPEMLHLYGFSLGIMLFGAVLSVLWSTDNMAVNILLILPLLLAFREVGDQLAIDSYGWFTKVYGVEILDPEAQVAEMNEAEDPEEDDEYAAL